MKKIWNWFKESNRWQHLLVGLIIGLTINNIFYSLYLTLLVGIASEYKDRLYGNKWDWLDLSLTVLGGLIGTSITMLILLII